MRIEQTFLSQSLHEWNACSDDYAKYFPGSSPGPWHSQILGSRVLGLSEPPTL